MYDVQRSLSPYLRRRTSPFRYLVATNNNNQSVSISRDWGDSHHSVPHTERKADRINYSLKQINYPLSDIDEEETLMVKRVEPPQTEQSNKSRAKSSAKTRKLAQAIHASPKKVPLSQKKPTKVEKNVQKHNLSTSKAKQPSFHI
eukprot:TRINITY_DN1833_c0_g1_i7.p1 TRINITY_DN1833_c0_g1~~TRINITY_DN1833_c0_g1_i7.p1  ORF type:complete len:145 (+),score=2.36 TRINITY_DN1833_c0_g1_i7:171-605(+)